MSKGFTLDSYYLFLPLSFLGAKFCLVLIFQSRFVSVISKFISLSLFYVNFSSCQSSTTGFSLICYSEAILDLSWIISISTLRLPTECWMVQHAPHQQPKCTSTNFGMTSTQTGYPKLLTCHGRWTMKL
ncbi:hypothetical protein [Shahe hepe-like virus 2]|uniref:hypothetical protein n=1 Tax=Shahe hepe-like virus 2 TaxID=1923416 RepID=UPI000909AD86|nr:hypothetical protein [Shahe hepe-like virus 2]APG77715.1 hypothetical protein [Shahe hepe-like virus 2]